jgi:ribosomal protein S18 acetylase RimI-like enzyme
MLSMDYRLLPIQQLDARGLERLALLHRAVMHTLLSELGPTLLLRYYQACQQDPSVIGFYASSSAGEIMGWAVGSPRPAEVNARLRTPLVWFAGQMLRLAFTRPRVLWQLVVSTFSSSGQMDSAPGSIELTYIGVSAEARGRGVGRALLNAFVNASRIAGYRSIVLSVERENTEAISLYEKSGFGTVRTFTEGHFVRHRMELSLG